MIYLLSKYTLNNNFVSKMLAATSLALKNMSQFIIHQRQGR